MWTVKTSYELLKQWKFQSNVTSLGFIANFACCRLMYMQKVYIVWKMATKSEVWH
jgi:hypothetical protein